jgi:hypothetical protein
MSTPAGRPLPGVEVTEVDGRFFLLHPADSRVMVLNQSAYAVWQIWQRAPDFEALVGEVAALFAKPASDIRSDVQAALEDFSVHGFLRG